MTPSPDLIRRAKEIYLDVIELAPKDRAAFLDERCEGDAALRAEVESLLAHHSDTTGRFASPLESDSFQEALASGIAAPPPAAAPGDAIGRYKVLRLLGRGGMGEVYLAEQTEPITRRVAIKIVRSGMDSREVISRFQAERQTLAMMEHPNIARVFDAGATEEGRPYFVMEHVDGSPIGEHCDQHTLSPRERLELFRQVCDAVQHAHQKGIIHRDLKPGNIIIEQREGQAIPKVIDFGVARAADPGEAAGATMATAQGRIIGTPAYMSPEQINAGAADIDTRTDIYSLGVVLYELLVGATPHSSQNGGRGLVDTFRMIVETDPPTPSTRLNQLDHKRADSTARTRRADLTSLRRQLRGDLDWITMRAVARDRDRRYSSASELSADIHRFLSDEPVSARPPSPVYRARKFVRRNRAPVAAGVIALAAIVTGAVWAGVEAAKARREAERSQQIALFLREMLSGVQPSVALGRDTELLREILNRTTERVDESLGDQPIVEASIRQTLGSTYADIGEVDKALQQISRAYELRRRNLGDMSPETLASQESYAVLLLSADRLDEAEPVIRDVIERRTRVLGADSIETLQSRNTLAGLLTARGQFDDAGAIHSEILDTAERTLGPRHEFTTLAMNEAAGSLWRRGRRNEAIELYERAYELRMETLGEKHPDTLYSISNLAFAYAETDRLDKAAVLSRRAYEGRLAVLGETHPNTLLALNNLAYHQFQDGDLEGALETFRKVHEAYVQSEGPQSEMSTVSLNNVGVVLRSMGRMEKAAEILEEVLAIRRQSRGDLHPQTLHSVFTLGELRRMQDRPEDAATLFREALEGRRHALGIAHLTTQETARALAETLAELGRVEEATTLLSDALRRLQEVDNARDEDVEAGRSLLADLKSPDPANVDAPPPSDD